MEYPSKYSNGKMVSEAQYIAEFICERKAKREKIDLHYRFWLSKDWEKEYKGQIAAAHKLLKKYDCKSIIEALNSRQGTKIYSLRAPHLSSIIDTIVAQKDKNKIEIKPKNIERNLLDKGRIDFKKTNILDKLKEIDDGTTR